jgi:ubiquinone/menaquinone biosynthesis C-methylase UbiE
VTSTAHVQSDFDEIARLAEPGASGVDYYDPFLLSLIPSDARHVLDVGCGLGRLTMAVATERRHVVGVDLSPEMINRARQVGASDRLSFRVGDFLDLDFSGRTFDCIMSAAALHHMDHEAALARMIALLAPGGRLVVHDLRAAGGLFDLAKGGVVLAYAMTSRFSRTGRFRSSRRVRALWARHGASDSYLTRDEARALANRLMPGATFHNHWMWRYTIVWDKMAV